MDTRTKIIQILSSYGDSCETDFMDNGINSISFIKLLVEMEDEFGIEFEDEMLNIKQVPSLEALCAYIDELINPKNAESESIDIAEQA